MLLSRNKSVYVKDKTSISFTKQKIFWKKRQQKHSIFLILVFIAICSFFNGNAVFHSQNT